MTIFHVDCTWHGAVAGCQYVECLYVPLLISELLGISLQQLQTNKENIPYSQHSISQTLIISNHLVISKNIVWTHFLFLFKFHFLYLN